MKREEIIKKYHLHESHSIWQPEIDNWHSIEAMRAVLGRLPDEKDDTVEVLMKFLDDKDLQMKLLKEKGMKFGSMFLSAKRALYRYTIANSDSKEKESI